MVEVFDMDLDRLKSILNGYHKNMNPLENVYLVSKHVAFRIVEQDAPVLFDEKQGENNG